MSKCLRLMEAEEKKFSLSQFLTEDNGDNSLQRERMKKLMREGIKHELTVRQRTCISMKFIDKMKAEEIADELNISPATVYKHIRVGLKRLKKLQFYL